MVGLFLSCIILAACQPGDHRHTAEYQVFGAPLTVTVIADERPADLFARLGHDFRRMHTAWHPWEPGTLMDLNQALAENRTAETTPELAAMIRRAQDLERASGGLFNPALGGLVNLWGFHTSEYPLTAPPPEAGAIRALLADDPDMAHLDLDGTRVTAESTPPRLDFSGMAKGYALELGCDRVLADGVAAALLNAGGDVHACGSPDRHWRVGVRDPAGGVLAGIKARGGEAVFTSGNYHRYGEFDGTRYAHILDPRDGRPVDHVAQVTVIHADPVRADAAATALVVAGPDDWPGVAQDMGIEQVLVVDTAGDLQATPAMAGRLDFSDGSRTPTIRTRPAN